MARPRTTKGLAKRVELTYYRRLHPFRRWWRILCVVLPATGLSWLIIMALLGDQRIYTSGPVVTAHRMFGTDCSRCHADVARIAPAGGSPGELTPHAASAPPAAPSSVAHGGFFRRVSVGACLRCHDGAIHHEDQTFEPRCALCHIEHKGRTTLARMTDRHCTLCHADLKVRSGVLHVEPHVPNLAEHPEFALFRKAVKDEAAIELSHARHLKANLPAGEGKRVTLACISCHQEDAAGKYLLPVAYERHCKGCHPLEAAPNLIVPHQRPEIVRGFLLAALGVGGAPPPAVPAPEAPTGQPPAEEPGSKPGRRRGGAGAANHEFQIRRVSDAGWMGQVVMLLAQLRRGGAAEPTEGDIQQTRPQRPAGDVTTPNSGRGSGGAPRELPQTVAQAERTIFFGGQGCPKCHTVERTAGLPRIVPPRIPVRWLPHSVFDHRVHRPLACVACHADAPKSVETADVLIPKLGVCQECHRPGTGAGSGCVECHLYHDRDHERTPDGPLSVPEFVSGRTGESAPPARTN